jgi:DNA primase
MSKFNLDSLNFNEIITREDILRRITQEEIYSYYMGEDISELGVFHSPLRDDNVPSFSLFFHQYDRQCLMFKDFATGDSGDCFILVMKLFSISFFEALKKIAFDFGLINSNIDLQRTPITYTRIVNKEKVKLGVRIRKWSLKDKYFWQQFGITKATLEKFNVHPIDYVFYNDVAVKTHQYAYVYVEYKDGITSYKIYQPFEDKLRKWITNSNYSVHQGYTQLPENGELLIITKSLKDVMSILDCLELPSVGLQSESIMMKQSVMNEYKQRFKEVICLFDNDEAGKKLAVNFSDQYGIPYFFVPRKTKKTTDFSDLVRDTGKEKAIKIVKKLINEVRTK